MPRGASVAAGGKSRVQQAKNRADRVSHGLGDRDVEKLVKATDFATQIGLPFNRFVTIHWEMAGVPNPLAATAKFLKLMREWVGLRGGRFAYVYVRENGIGKGEHVHILMHLPPHLGKDVGSKQPGWMKIIGARSTRGVVVTRRIARTLGQAMLRDRDGGYYDFHLAEVLQYILKGASNATLDRLGFVKREPGGEIVGKRCGMSENIGAKARAHTPRQIVTLDSYKKETPIVSVARR